MPKPPSCPKCGNPHWTTQRCPRIIECEVGDNGTAISKEAVAEIVKGDVLRISAPKLLPPITAVIAETLKPVKQDVRFAVTNEILDDINGARAVTLESLLAKDADRRARKARSQRKWRARAKAKAAGIER